MYIFLYNIFFVKRKKLLLLRLVLIYILQLIRNVIDKKYELTDGEMIFMVRYEN